MTNKFLHLKALQRIIDEQQEFQVVLERLERSKNLSKDNIASFRHCVLGALKHFRYLQFEACTAFPQYESDADEIYLIILALFDLRYCSKEVPLFQVVEQVFETIDYMELSLDKEEVKNKLHSLAHHRTKIPEDMKNNTYVYNSLFFNTPEWLLKLMINDLGDGQCMNTLIANQRRSNQYLCCNDVKCDFEKINSDPRFISVNEEYLNTFEYRLGNATSLDEVINGELFVMDLSLSVMSSYLSFFEQQKSLYIGESYSSFPCKIALLSKEHNGTLDCLMAHDKEFARIKNLSNRLEINNITPYLGSIDIMLTYNEYETYDLVLLNPLSSSLGQVKRRPDILVTLCEKQIENYGRLDYKKLFEASKFVCKGGTLVYFVPTFSKIETSEVISKFIDNNQEFTLDYSCLILPYEYDSDGLYFAVLKRSE